MTLLKKLSLYQQNREISSPLPTGSAPYTSSRLFRLQDYGLKPKASRWDHRLSSSSRLQTPSLLKTASRGKQANIVSLGTARPSAEYYPWLAINMQCLDTASSNIYGQPKSSITTCEKEESNYDLAVAMNYGYSAGSPQLLRFITEHVELTHSPVYEDWECTLTCGTTSALEIAFRILCNSGDHVLLEKYTYSGTITAIKAQGLHTFGIEMDALGLCPKDLNAKLESWDSSKHRKPFVLYTIPTGQNPTGTTQSAERRRDLYRVAQKHDLYIIEDDPYYFLQMNNYGKSVDEYLAQLPPSYLSLDTDGRVLRLDTASKILAPGLRCGWATGCSQIIEKFLSHSEVGVLSPSGPSQVMMYKLMDQTWGHDGFIKWLISLSQQYRHRRDTMMQALELALPPTVCRWNCPEAGMFVWVIADGSKLPGFNRVNVSSRENEVVGLDLEDRVYGKAQDNGVLVSKGSWFLAQSAQNSQDVCFRLTFAAAPENSLCRAIDAFAQAVKEAFLRN